MKKNNSKKSEEKKVTKKTSTKSDKLNDNVKLELNSNIDDVNKVEEKVVPVLETNLRHQILNIPPEARSASGIVIFGRRIKTLVFTTDIAIIRNCDADAVFAVYPFTPQQTISDAIIKASYIPVFCGIGGGTTRGDRTVSLASDVESQGAMAVVMNSPISNDDVKKVSKVIDIPIVITVVSKDTDIDARIESGASILNIAGGAETCEIVKAIRKKYPSIPIIASGGPDGESIKRTIEAGANAITYTPPSTGELFSTMMKKYRK